MTTESHHPPPPPIDFTLYDPHLSLHAMCTIIQVAITNLKYIQINCYKNAN